MRSSPTIERKGDCCNWTASPWRSAPSKTGSPVVFEKSARISVSLSVSRRAWPLCCHSRNAASARAVAAAETMPYRRERRTGLGEHFRSHGPGICDGVNFGQPEVQDLGMAARGDENIGGIDIAVYDPLRVCGIECVGNLDGESYGLGDWGRPAGDILAERL